MKDNIKYIIKKGSKVEDYEHYEEKEKALFNIKNVFDNVALEQKYADVLYLSELKTIRYKAGIPIKKDVLRLGVFSNLINYMNVYLYNEPLLMKKNPTMFFSENLLFINADFIKPLYSMKEVEDKKIDFTGLLLIIGMTKLIEQKFQVVFTYEEKITIIKKELENSLAETQIDIALELINFKKVDQEISYNKLSDFCSYLEKEEFSKHTQKRMKERDNYNEFINNILFESNELKDVNNPLSKLNSKIKEPKFEDLEISIDSFNEIYNLGENVKNSELIINSLIKEHQEVLIKTYKENNDFIETAEKLNDWINYTMELNDNHFVYVLSKFRNDSEELYQSRINQLIENVVRSMNIHKNCGITRREIAINVATGINDLNDRRVNFEAIPKDIHEKHEKYIKACELGELDTIKLLVNNTNSKENIDINTNGAFKIAAKKNQIEVMKYLLMSNELENKIEINKKNIELISSKEIIHQLIIEKHLTDEQLIVHYDSLLNKVCKFQDIDSINYLLSMNKENQKISTVLYKIFYDMEGTKGLEIVNILNEKIKETSIDEYDYFEKIRLTFIGAVSSQKIDIVKFFIFDNNIARLDEARIVEEGYETTQGEILDKLPEVRGWFDLRDLNQNLNQVLPIEEKLVIRKKM